MAIPSSSSSNYMILESTFSGKTIFWQRLHMILQSLGMYSYIKNSNFTIVKINPFRLAMSMIKISLFCLPCPPGSRPGCSIGWILLFHMRFHFLPGHIC